MLLHVSLPEEDAAIRVESRCQQGGRGVVYGLAQGGGLVGDTGGVQIDQANPALVKEIQSKAQPVIQAWIKDAKEKRNIDGAMVLKEFREELKRVAAGK